MAGRVRDVKKGDLVDLLNKQTAGKGEEPKRRRSRERVSEETKRARHEGSEGPV
jgi:hypothetical protein